MKENYRVHGFSKQQILSWSAFPCNLIKYRISSSRLPFTPRHKMFLLILYLYTRYFSLIVSSWNWNSLLIVSSLPGFWKYNINKNDTSSLYGASADAFVWNWASFQSKFSRGVKEGARVFFSRKGQQRNFPCLAKISVTSPIVMNMPIRELLAGEKESSFVWHFQHLDNKNNVCKQMSLLYICICCRLNHKEMLQNETKPTNKLKVGTRWVHSLRCSQILRSWIV